MADNKGKIDRLHDLLPSHFNTKNNPNWKALLEAIGEVDQGTADLVAEVRKQFFVKTASRPYLDRLGANNKIARPRLVGMDDPSFREYIPVLSYKPKQVKLIVDQLLDIFFFKESTTAFVTSQNFAPFVMQDQWELEYFVDEVYSERVKFSTADFTNIAAATADEVVAAINRQTKYSYATAYYDSITKNTFIKLFTKTIGSKGSLRISGGRANIPIRFNGFIDNAGNGSNTQWTITKIGDLTTFQHVGGTAPGIDRLQVDDIIIINLAGNQGSFPITEIDIATNKISFVNLFSTPTTISQTSETDVKFVRPNKYVAYTNGRRAMTWETSPGEIVVEMPTSPPVVKRSLKGSWHVNGVFSNMNNRVSDTALTVADATGFPESGSFLFEEVEEIVSRWLTPTEDTVSSFKSNTRLQYANQKYEYTSRVSCDTTGDIVEGSDQITNLASVVGISIGDDVAMEGVPGWAKVTSIAGSLVNLSRAATESAVGRPVKFLGNQLNGISPALPGAAGLNEFALTSLSRTSSVVTAVTAAPHGYQVGEFVIIGGSSGIAITTTTGDISSGSPLLTNLATVSGVAPGMIIQMTGVPANTYVTDLVGNTATLSNNATSTVVGGSATFLEDMNGSQQILTASGTNFTFLKLGSDGTPVTAGTARVERSGISNSGSKVIVMDAVRDTITRMTGTYVWDLAAAFVLSSNKAFISDEIKAGKIVRLMNTTADSDIASTGGFLIFDYGLNTQEGPVRYLYKPTANTIAIDPSYVFQKNHTAGSAVVAVRTKGPHTLDTRAGEYAPYITNPSEARFILEDLIKSVKSAGIFVNFLVRYPEQLYATLDVYQSGIDPG